MRSFLILGSLVVSAALFGCDTSSIPSDNTAANPPDAPLPPAPPPPPQANPPLVNPTGDGTTTVPPNAQSPVTSPETATQQPAGGGDQSPAAPPATSGEANTETVKAEAGVGIKGRSLDEYEGALVTPAKAYFSVREKAIFEVRVPKALKLHKALEGELPTTFAEIKAQVLDPNAIQLPALPPGHEYGYDAENEQLTVIRPKSP